MRVTAQVHEYLGDVLARRQGETPNVPFLAVYEDPLAPFDERAFTGQRVQVTAVLQRTAVVDGVGLDAKLIKLERLLVDAGQLSWRVDNGSRVSENGQASAKAVFTGKRSTPPTEKRRQELRDASDERALKNREDIQQRPGRIGVKRSRALKEQGLRHCAQCGKDKPVAEFWQNGYCKACGRAKDRAMHKNRLRFKTCPSCRQVKPHTVFPPGSGRHRCADCIANPPAKATWKPSLVVKLRARRLRVAATLAEIDAQLAGMAASA